MGGRPPGCAAQLPTEPPPRNPSGAPEGELGIVCRASGARRAVLGTTKEVLGSIIDFPSFNYDFLGFPYSSIIDFLGFPRISTRILSGL